MPAALQDETIISPIVGQAVALSDVDDPVFSSGAMGSMGGEGFDQKIAQVDKVKAGDVLGTFEAEKIAAAGLDDTTMVIVTNTADYASVTPVAEGALAKGDAIIEVKA